MRRTTSQEVIMSQVHAHLHTEFDRYPLLLEEFGTYDVDKVIDAEAADFHWDSRFAERNLGAYEGFDEGEEDGEIVRIIGFFHSQYYVVTCVVDGKRRVRIMLRLTHFDSVESAETAFLAGGG